MLAPGGAGRFAGGAGLAGFALTALVGGGVIAQQVVVPGALHDSARSAVPAPRPSLQSPAPRATPIADVGSSAGPSQGATVVVRSAPSVTPRTNRSVTRPRRVVARSPLAAISAVAAPSPSSTPPPRTGDDDHDDVSVERHEPAVDQRNGASSGERSVPEERQGRRGHSGARSVPDDPEPNEQQPDEPAPAERQEIPTPDPPEQGTDHSGPPVSAAGTSATSPESLESPTPTEPAEEPDHG